MSVYLGGVICFALAGLCLFVMVVALTMPDSVATFVTTAAMALAIFLVGRKIVKDERRKNSLIRKYLG